MMWFVESFPTDHLKYKLVLKVSQYVTLSDQRKCHPFRGSQLVTQSDLIMPTPSIVRYSRVAAGPRSCVIGEIRRWFFGSDDFSWFA